MCLGCDDNIIALGQDGRDGTNGVSNYLFIGYATSNTGTGFSLTQDGTKNYIAFITKNNSTTPSASEFAGKWFEYKGSTSSPSFNVEEEGVTQVTGVSVMNFIGPGVTADNAGGGQADITIIAAGLKEVNRASALNLISTDSLLAGAWYWIYDVADGIGLGSGYAGIILRAITNNKFDPNGLFIARIPNRTNTSLYSKTGTIVTNQYYESCGEVYRSVNGTNNNLLPTGDLTSADWEFITKDNNTYYVTEIQGCNYDIANNIIKQRWDSRNNKLTNLGTQNYLMLQSFRWGLNNFSDNNITFTETGSTLTDRLSSAYFTVFGVSTLNGEFKNNNIKDGGRFIDFGFDLNTENHNNNYIYNDGLVKIMDVDTVVADSKIFDSATIEDNTNCAIRNVNIYGLGKGIIDCIDSDITNVSGKVLFDTLDTFPVTDVQFTEAEGVTLNSFTNCSNGEFVGGTCSGLTLFDSDGVNWGGITVIGGAGNVTATADVASAGSSIRYFTLKSIGTFNIDFINGVSNINGTFDYVNGTFSATYDAAYGEAGLVPNSGDGSSLSTTIYVINNNITSSTGKIFFNPTPEHSLYITPDVNKYGALLDITDTGIYTAATDKITLADELILAGTIYIHDTSSEPVSKIDGALDGSLITFKVWDGTGIIMTPTAFASHVANSGDFQSSLGNQTLVNQGDFYTIRFAYTTISTHNYYRINSQITI